MMTSVTENAVVQPSSKARLGNMCAVHASVEKDGTWKLAVWLEFMMPLGTGMLGLARR
jgi:hypothetical protein